MSTEKADGNSPGEIDKIVSLESTVYRVSENARRLGVERISGESNRDFIARYQGAVMNESRAIAAYYGIVVEGLSQSEIYHRLLEKAKELSLQDGQSLKDLSYDAVRYYLDQKIEEGLDE